MPPRTDCLRLSTLPVAAFALLFAGCGGGGGGGDAGSVPAVQTVTAVSVGTPKYSQKLLVTVTGTALDRGLTLSSTACPGMALSTTAPNVSTATTAYYTCTVSALGASRVSVVGAGASELGSASYTVPAPQVTMTVGNGAAIAGSFVITLDPVKAPRTAGNFLSYVNAGIYDGTDGTGTKTVFHRVAQNFVVQGGGYAPFAAGAAPVAKATQAPIAFETTTLSNVQWSVAAARLQGAGADSATSQFLINLIDNAGALDPDTTSTGYAVFGAVTSGTAVVTLMTTTACGAAIPESECPPNPSIVITSATQTQ